MELTKDITVKCKVGDLSLHLGKELASLYFKNVEKMVLRVSELDVLVEMIKKSKELYEKKN